MEYSESQKQEYYQKFLQHQMNFPGEILPKELRNYFYLTDDGVEFMTNYKIKELKDKMDFFNSLSENDLEKLKLEYNFSNIGFEESSLKLKKKDNDYILNKTISINDFKFELVCKISSAKHNYLIIKLQLYLDSVLPNNYINEINYSLQSESDIGKIDQNSFYIKASKNLKFAVFLNNIKNVQIKEYPIINFNDLKINFNLELL